MFLRAVYALRFIFTTLPRIVVACILAVPLFFPIVGGDVAIGLVVKALDYCEVRIIVFYYM